MNQRDEWLAKRAKHISSTESAALFGMSPYMTAYELGVMKQSDSLGEIEDNERMTWGRRLQDAIAQGIADDHQVLIESQEYVYQVHATNPRMGASFDYRIVGVPTEQEFSSSIGAMFETHGPGLLEIKNVDALQYRSWTEGEAPDHMEIQIQHQLEVADLEWCVLGVLVGGNRTQLYLRRRDKVVGAAISSRVHAFWKNLEAGILPPAVLPQDADIIIKLHQYADPNKVFDGSEDTIFRSLCDEYLSAQQVAKEATEAQKSLKATILLHINDAERAFSEEYKLTSAMRAPSEVKAHVRAGFRDFRLTRVDPR